MSITKEQHAQYVKHRKYLHSASSSYGKTQPTAAEKKQKKEEEDRQKKLLSYLNQAKKSAIKRGMFNQKTYKTMVAEAKKNV